jgi:hypothetical protein
VNERMVGGEGGVVNSERAIVACLGEEGALRPPACTFAATLLLPAWLMHCPIAALLLPAWLVHCPIAALLLPAWLMHSPIADLSLPAWLMHCPITDLSRSPFPESWACLLTWACSCACLSSASSPAVPLPCCLS